MPQTAPGDLVEVAPSARARFLEGRLLRVLEPGHGRVATTCQHAPVCSACQWQQVGAPAQAEAKRQSLREALVRLGGVPREALPDITFTASPDAFRYRRRARFHVDSSGTLGYSGHGGSAPVPLRECHLLTGPLETLALSLSRLLRALVPRPHHVEACVIEGRAAVLLDLDPPMALPSLRSLGERVLAELSTLSGVVVRAGDRTVEVGTPTLPDGATFVRPDAFAQANATVNATLVSAAVAALDCRPGDRVLELFAGNGNFTLPLARNAGEVTAVESEGVSLSLLRRAVAQARLAHVRVHGGDAAELTQSLARQGQHFDLALLDPPRLGAKAVVAPLAKLRPRRIAYVSCEPSTLSRDVRELRQLGYQLRSAGVFDQFPQTFHLEALVILDRVG